MKGLTKRQREILDFVEEFIDSNQYSPSYREIMTHFGFSSLGSIYKHIHALKRKGFLSSEKQCSRSIAPTRAEPEPTHAKAIDLPLMGQLSPGSPLETFPQMKSVTVPQQMVTNPEYTYVIRVKGDGLQSAFLLHGDLLLVEARQEATPGETVLANYNGQTIVRLVHAEDDFLRLESWDPKIPALIVDAEDLDIQGVIRGLIRAY